MFDEKIDMENLADDKWANFIGELILKHVEISRANAIQVNKIIINFFL